jgi:hypothetical protein
MGYDDESLERAHRVRRQEESDQEWPFTTEIILRTLDRYLQFPIGDRELEGMFSDLSVHVAHTALVGSVADPDWS